MAKKRTARNVKSASTKANPRRASSARTSGLTETFEGAKSSVTRAASAIPSSAVYWGLGALALGAAAVGAYMYRDRIVEMYEEGMDFINNQSEEINSGDEDRDEQDEITPRQTKSSIRSSQTDSH